MKKVLKDTILLSLFCAMPAVSLAQTTSQSEAAGVREAIRFEKAKDAADARQARLEAQRPTGYAERSADDNSAIVKEKNAVPDKGVQDAIRFERNKDAADAHQARVEGQSSNTESSRGAADRRVIKHQ